MHAKEKWSFTDPVTFLIKLDRFLCKTLFLNSIGVEWMHVRLFINPMLSCHCDNILMKYLFIYLWWCFWCKYLLGVIRFSNFDSINEIHGNLEVKRCMSIAINDKNKDRNLPNFNGCRNFVSFFFFKSYATQRELDFFCKHDIEIGRATQ